MDELTTDAELSALLKSVHRIAVLGIKTEAQDGQPAFTIPRYLLQAGYDVVPVPVYYPDVTEILGRPVFRKLTDIPGEVDLVDVFRRPVDIPAHVPELLAKRPRAVWFQQGIRHDEAAHALLQAGIQVVQDRCILVDHRRLISAAGG